MKTHNRGDWAIALVVVACSAILLAALWLSLRGGDFDRHTRTLQVDFSDVTGINVGANVKYAGAPAGHVARILILTPEERARSADPHHAVRLVLAIDKRVPPLPSDIVASVSADTLLSDKFIHLSGGSPDAPPLDDGAIVRSIAPTTIDELVRTADASLRGLGEIFGDKKGEFDGLLPQVRKLLTEAQSAIGDARGILSDGRSLVGDGRAFASSHADQLARVLAQVDSATAALDAFARRGDGLVKANEKMISSTLADLRVTSQNLKVTSTYTKTLTRSLAERPSQIIWGNARVPALPSETEILKKNQPIPSN